MSHLKIRNIIIEIVIRASLSLSAVCFVIRDVICMFNGIVYSPDLCILWKELVKVVPHLKMKSIVIEVVNGEMSSLGAICFVITDVICIF